MHFYVTVCHVSTHKHSIHCPKEALDISFSCLCAWSLPTSYSQFIKWSITAHLTLFYCLVTDIPIPFFPPGPPSLNTHHSKFRCTIFFFFNVEYFSFCIRNPLLSIRSFIAIYFRVNLWILFYFMLGLSFCS